MRRSDNLEHRSVLTTLSYSHPPAPLSWPRSFTNYPFIADSRDMRLVKPLSSSPAARLFFTGGPMSDSFVRRVAPSSNATAVPGEVKYVDLLRRIGADTTRHPADTRAFAVTSICR